ncbi:flavodoxin family protein [Nocardioides rubriscoriae]|uniref:flavodoxin family protein n=1 Tax=Nocardioides rubriscoriae TaxID=642762 RepID=UPI001B85F76B|nr:flavodoxin family protein [Nocardioides rubriscoriae]
MKVAVVVESMFGNTQAVGEAVAAGLRERGAEATLLLVGDEHDHALADDDLLVLGAPTHGLTMSRPGTRADAVTQGADATRAATGVREWLEALDDGAARPPVAVFDTRAPGDASLAGIRVARGRPQAAPPRSDRGGPHQLLRRRRPGPSAARRGRARPAVGRAARVARDPTGFGPQAVTPAQPG